MTWSTDAGDLLAAAVSSGVAVDRSFVAPGPDFAKDCRLLAVHLAAVEPRAGGKGLPAVPCILVPTYVWVVTFVADCAPLATVEGQRVTPPPAADITAWSGTMLDDAQLVWEAVADYVLDGDCTAREVGGTEMFGPGGQVAGARITVRLTSMG